MMGIKIRRNVAVSTIKRWVMAMAAFLIVYLLLGKLFEFNQLFTDINTTIPTFFLCVIIFLCRGKLATVKSRIFNGLLLMMILSSIIRRDQDILDTVLRVFVIYVFASVGTDEYKYIAFGIALASVRYILPFIGTMLAAASSFGTEYHLYVGNRFPMLSTTVGFLLIIHLYSRKKYIYTVSILTFNFLCSFFAGSRTALAAELVAVLLFVLAEMRMRNKTTGRKIFLAVIMIVIIIAFIMMQNAFMNLIVNKWEDSSTNITSSRLMIWGTILSEVSFWGKPEGFVLNLFGLPNAHNSFVEAYVQFGVLVAVLYIFWYISCAVKVFRDRSDARIQPFLIFFLPYILMSMFESTFILDDYNEMLGLCSALINGQIMQISLESSKWRIKRGERKKENS